MSRLFLVFLLFLFVPLCFSQIAENKILSFITHNKLDGNKVVEKVEVRILIANHLGDDLSKVKIFSSDNHNLNNISASIKDIRGATIRTLKSQDIENTIDYANRYFHADTRINSFSMYHNQYPYILEYSYEYSISNYVSLASWYPLMYKDIPVVKAVLKVTVPSETELKVCSQYIDTTYQEENDDYITYTFEKNNYLLSPAERYALKYADTEPYVVLMSPSFFYETKGESSDWESIGEWISNNNSHLYELTSDEKVIVDELVKDCTSTKQKVKVLYHYLQDNTRYINVSFKTGGLMPFPATYVCANKYGDCKALTVYMKALLKYAGIESNYSIIYSGKNPDMVEVNFPSLQFNHVILQVPIEGDTLWLENTDKACPFNYLGTFTQNRYALSVKKGNSKLVKTPTLTPTNTLSKTNIAVHINNKAQVIFNARVEARGSWFDALLQYNTQLSVSEQKLLIDKLRLISRASIDSFSIAHIHRDSTYLNVNFNGTLNNIANLMGNRMMLQPVKRYYFDLESIEKRTKDIKIPYPINSLDTIIFTFEKELAAVKGVHNKLVETEFGSYSFKYVIQSKTLSLLSHFILKQGFYPLESYIDFYGFINQIETISNSKVLVTFKQ